MSKVRKKTPDGVKTPADTPQGFSIFTLRADNIQAQMTLFMA